MPRSAVIAIGFCGGVIVAGIVNAALVTLLPDDLRGAAIVWATTLVLTTGSTAAAWILAGRRRSPRP